MLYSPSLGLKSPRMLLLVVSGREIYSGKESRLDSGRYELKEGGKTRITTAELKLEVATH